MFLDSMATIAVDKKTSARKEPRKPRFSPAYDPNSPEVKERRRRLFAALEAEHTPEAVDAMERAYQSSLDDGDLE